VPRCSRASRPASVSFFRWWLTVGCESPTAGINSQTQAGSSQYGRHRDDWGNWFGGNNNVWAWHYFLPEQYLARNPHLVVKETRRTLATYPNQSRLFPISREMPRFNFPDQVNALLLGHLSRSA